MTAGRMVRVKRIYEPPSPADGRRILVDRLWPRGLSRDKAKIDEWVKDLAPSDALRRWFGHDPPKWAAFRKRYREELSGQEELLRTLARRAARGTVTLVYGARNPEHNNAVALRGFLEELLKRKGRG